MRKIIHIDMDAFFASVEQRDRPELRGRPVIVGGAPQRRGVVSTCSYEARKYGVHSAMPSATALRLCPHAVFIEPDHRRYQQISKVIRQEFFRLTDLVEPMSIDEAYLDVTASCPELSDAVNVACQLQQRIFETTGLTASAGVSYNKFLAKTASDYRKPAGLTLISPEDAPDFLDRLPVEKFYGIGRVSVKKLHSINVKTGADMKKLSLSILKSLFGKAGIFYYGIVRGVDDRQVELEGDPKSISREITLYKDSTSAREIRILLRMLGRKVARRAQAKGLAGSTVTIKLKYADFQTVTRSMTLGRPTSDGVEIGNAAAELFNRISDPRPIRLAGTGITQLAPVCEHVSEQLMLPFNSGFSAK
ncbi:MAG: DNA polymerase IV [Lentisphaerae bacterium]|nr:DNA polymerase IV [Lentisphaerota bacterium]